MADASPAPPPDLSGLTVGDFELLRKLGQGGMGQVYLARQLSLKREVAVKILRDDLSRNPTALQRFQAEAEAIARINHPNIVQVFAVGERDGLRYMALEFVRGRNLREYLDRRGPPELPVALAILKQTAAALQRASELGLVHRDIKPENILVTKKVEVKVADFGLSRDFVGGGIATKLTQTGTTLGTPLYMSPEQVLGKPVDHRSDLYSFGVTAYHLLAGEPPFRGTTAFDIAVQHVQNEAKSLAEVRPDLPIELVQFVHRLMAKNPDDRPAQAKDAIRDLVRIQRGLLSSAETALYLNGTMTGTAIAVPSGTTAILPAMPARARRWFRYLPILAVIAAGALGWWAASIWLHRGEPLFGRNGVGGSERILPAMSGDEVALRERAYDASLPAKEQIDACLDLVLLFLAENRLDDAERAAKDLETHPARTTASDPSKRLPLPVSILGKLAGAIVLAHRDKPKESNALIEATLSSLTKSTAKLGVEQLCFEKVEFGRALSEAVNRNVDNLPKETRIPPAIDWLRYPSSILRGPR